MQIEFDPRKQVITFALRGLDFNRAPEEQMNGKSEKIDSGWVDPDDAPELTAEWFEKATLMIGEREVSLEEFRAAADTAFPAEARPTPIPQQPVSINFDADILEAFKATGDGWEARMNSALRDWMKTHLV